MISYYYLLVSIEIYNFRKFDLTEKLNVLNIQIFFAKGLWFIFCFSLFF